ncbi:MAG TPA: GNAT family N-acetyltransferase [Lachnoclostridium sp.]|uniref:Acetyltransferase (GNAT) family protein n=1 Tax=[Clostridium] celerecrescens 18A TaxID=1286362 RepID=A0A2M8Z981_9FIRM|nr:GNAT family N-acetyltransferase [Lacrimispora celerecrescens]PJJ29984.1 acetyltransferase (GNAT) family protein [[Clostridium] celerecrescens 18A]HBE86222.1 GNAT family N-acetyltransferase [Lachnoclostridium sp.]
MIEDYIVTQMNKDSIKKYGALDLVWQVFLEFEAPEYSDEGIQEFKNFIDLNSIEQKIDKNEMLFWGCFCGENIVGVVATRQPCHISLLFVDKEHHRQGIGRELLSTITSFYKEAGVNREMTVNSSPYAVEIYHKLGFMDTDTEQLVNGIRFTPMKYVFS